MEREKIGLNVTNEIFIDQAHKMYPYFLTLVHNKHILYMHTHLSIYTLHVYLKPATDKKKGPWLNYTE